ncbi:hypothetical protein GCM10009084_20720 [Marinomonas primoryensis]
MKKTLLASAIIATSFIALQAQAADVPAGVELAAKQELVRGGGAEPATLDPQKMEGTPGSIRSKDLFEGLYNQDGDGNQIPGVATSYDVNADNTHSTFVKMRNGLTAIQSPPKTLFTLSRALSTPLLLHHTHGSWKSHPLLTPLRLLPVKQNHPRWELKP